MLSYNELLGFMSPELANEIITSVFEDDRELYKETLKAIATSRKVRAVYLQRQPKEKRNQLMLQSLAKPDMNLATGNMLRGWLIKRHTPMLCDFLDALEIEHNEGMVEDLPETMEDAKVKTAVEVILEKHPKQVVAVYLHTFNIMNDTRWTAIDDLLDNDERLQFI